MSSAIPILDLSVSSSDDDSTVGVTLDVDSSLELVAHLSTVGFVYLANHGVDAAAIAAARRAAFDFFARDDAFKESHAVLDENVDRPYGYKGFETERFNPEQKIKDAKESVMFDAHRPETNVWPTEALREAVIPLTHDLGRLARKILRMIGLGLGLTDPDAIAEAHSFHLKKDDNDDDGDGGGGGVTPSDSFTAVRMNHYPLLAEGSLKDGQVPCSEHADWGSITLLLQDDVPGLEVQTVRNGAFVLAEPVEGTIILNIGLMLEN